MILIVTQMRPGACLLLAALLVAGGCSSQPDATAPSAPSDAPATAFTDQDRQIAQALSIWKQSPVAGETPRERAVACDLALAEMAQRLVGTSLLSAEQIRAFQLAREAFQRQANGGITTAEELREAMGKAEEKYPDAAGRTRLAVGCLRELSQGIKY